VTAQRLTKRQREQRESILRFYQTFKCIECGSAGSDMRLDDASEKRHLRHCQCGALYNVSIGRPRFADTFEAHFDFRVGSHEWHLSYDAKWDESYFWHADADGHREYEHKGYLSPKRFVRLFAFL
jgi:transcription elongation factor Elf1